MIARHVKPSVPVIAVVTGTLVIIWMTFSKSESFPVSLRNPLHTNMTIVVGALTIYLVGSLLGKLSGSNKFEVNQ
jgi:SSS family solute:Na+ symporter